MNLKETFQPALHKQWLKLFKKLNILLRWVFGVKLQPVIDVIFSIEETDCIMKKARVKLAWNPSPADDVIGVKVKVVDPDDGQIFFDETVAPNVTEVVLPELLNEKQRLRAVVIANDGVNDSEPVTVDFTVPDLTAPAPVSDAAFFYDVVDVEDEE